MHTLLPLEIVPIEDEGFHIITAGKVNGDDARLLIDTGASRTVFDIERITLFPGIDPKVFKKLEKLSSGLGTNTMESFTIILEEFRLGDLPLKDFETVLIDMSHVNKSYEMLEMPAIDGVIGGDILADYNAVLDYGSKQLRLEGR